MNALKKSVEIVFTHIKETINIGFYKVELCRHEFPENTKKSHSRQQEIKHNRTLMPHHLTSEESQLNMLSAQSC